VQLATGPCHIDLQLSAAKPSEKNSHKNISFMRLPFSVQSNLMMRELLSALSAIFAFISFCPPPALLTLVGQRVEQKKKKGGGGTQNEHLLPLTRAIK